MKTDPCPNWLVTCSDPPWASTTAFAIAHPMPVALNGKAVVFTAIELVENQSCSSSSIPGPRSAMLTISSSPVASTEIWIGDSESEYFAFSSNCWSTFPMSSMSNCSRGNCSLASTRIGSFLLPAPPCVLGQRLRCVTNTLYLLARHRTEPRPSGVAPGGRR